jgi:hypothetical protein
LAQLEALREEIRGPATVEHQVYASYGHYWNLVDRINQDFHNFYRLPGGYSALRHGLESVVFLATMAARAIWEEYHCVRAYSQAGQRKHALEAAPRRTIPQFIVAAARQLVEEK